jgi:hypothetical protein
LTVRVRHSSTATSNSFPAMANPAH